MVGLEIRFLTRPSCAASVNLSSKLTVSAHDSPQAYWCGGERTAVTQCQGWWYARLGCGEWRSRYAIC